jgi:hypothetical protein
VSVNTLLATPGRALAGVGIVALGLPLYAYYARRLPPSRSENWHANIDAFTIVFQPAGMSTLFSMPADLLTNDDFDGEAVLGPGFGELLRRLGDVSSFADRARVTDAYLCAKRPAPDSINGITSAATKVLSSSGCVRVSDLAEHGDYIALILRVLHGAGNIPGIFGSE